MSERIVDGVLCENVRGEWLQVSPWEMTRRLTAARAERDEAIAKLEKVRDFLKKMEAGA